MERGGDWKHLAPLRDVRMNDGMGVYSCGLDREVWEGETLFTAITLARWEVEVCLPPCILFFWVNFYLFVYLCLVLSASASRFICCFVFSHPLVIVFRTFFAHSSTLFVFISLQLCLPSGVCSSFSLALASVSAMLSK